jgi:hypothetical protein
MLDAELKRALSNQRNGRFECFAATRVQIRGIFELSTWSDAKANTAVKRTPKM